MDTGLVTSKASNICRLCRGAADYHRQVRASSILVPEPAVTLCFKDANHAVILHELRAVR